MCSCGGARTADSKTSAQLAAEAQQVQQAQLDSAAANQTSQQNALANASS